MRRLREEVEGLDGVNCKDFVKLREVPGEGSGITGNIEKFFWRVSEDRFKDLWMKTSAWGIKKNCVKGSKCGNFLFEKVTVKGDVFHVIELSVYAGILNGCAARFYADYFLSVLSSKKSKGADTAVGVKNARGRRQGSKFKSMVIEL